MTPARIRLGVDLFAGAVVVSVALALAALTWRIQGYPGIGPAAAPVAPGPGSDTDIRPLIALAPFGTAVASTGEGGDGSIKLRAIFMAVPAEASVVLVAGAEGKVASYGVGQALGGGVIEAIQADQIVLRVASGQRVIGFNPTVGATGAAAAGSGANPTTAAASFTAVPPPPPTGAAAIRAMIPPSVQGLPPPAAIAPSATAGTAPASGYRVGTSPNPALLAAGLRPGDVVVKVNGAAVNAGTTDRDLMASATANGSARVELLRDGQRVSLTVPVR